MAELDQFCVKMSLDRTFGISIFPKPTLTISNRKFPLGLIAKWIPLLTNFLQVEELKDDANFEAIRCMARELKLQNHAPHTNATGFLGFTATQSFRILVGF